MINCEIREMFNSFEDIQLEATNNIGIVCNHFGGTAFRTRRSNSDRPFGFRGDPRYLVMFSQILISSGNIKDAMESTGFSRYKAKRFARILNTAAETRGLPPVHAMRPGGPKGIEIVCDQTGRVFPSVIAAARALGMDLSGLKRHVKGHPSYPAVKGCTFSKGNKPRAKEEYMKILAAVGKTSPIRIVCDQTGRMFPSAGKAAQAIGASRSAVCQHLKGRPGFRTVKGYTFSKVNRAQSAFN